MVQRTVNPTSTFEHQCSYTDVCMWAVHVDGAEAADCISPQRMDSIFGLTKGADQADGYVQQLWCHHHMMVCTDTCPREQRGVCKISALLQQYVVCNEKLFDKNEKQ